MIKEFDQAEVLANLITAHLNTHEGIISEDCKFCKAFIITGDESAFSSYKFVLLDVSN